MLRIDIVVSIEALSIAVAVCVLIIARRGLTVLRV
jgi:hypothetical protein